MPDPSPLVARRRRILLSIAAAVVVAAATIGSGFYAQKVLNPSELVHFFVPFPAGRIVRPMTVKRPDGSGVFTRPISINVDQRGILKRLLNPYVEGVSTHWLINVDTVPHRIGLKFVPPPSFPVSWEVGAAIPFDEATGTFARAVEPGAQIGDLGIDWLFFFPREYRTQKVWYQGALVVFDADTGANLTTIPVSFQQARVPEQPVAVADCCAS